MRIRNTGTFTSLFKDKKSKKLQNSRNQGFPFYFYLMGSARPKNIGTDPTDPDPDLDPQHWI
jgi:hypothetical protein